MKRTHHCCWSCEIEERREQIVRILQPLRRRRPIRVRDMVWQDWVVIYLISMLILVVGWWVSHA